MILLNAEDGKGESAEQDSDVSTKNQEEGNYKYLCQKMDKMMAFFQKSETSRTKSDKHFKTSLRNIQVTHNKLVDKVVSNAEKGLQNIAPISDLEARVELMELQRKETKRLIREMQSQIDSSNKIIIDLTTELKERKLILSGAKESKGESVLGTVLSKLNHLLDCAFNAVLDGDYQKDTFVRLNRGDIDMCSRIGKFNRNAYTPRNILVYQR